MPPKLTFYSSAKYTLVGEIGRGGMGVVFLAQRECEGVADLLVLKTIKKLSQEKMQSLIKEARLAATLRHENIVRTYGLEAIPVRDLPENFLRELANKPVEKKESNRTLIYDAANKIRNGETFTPSRKVIQSAEHKNDKKKLYMMVMDYIEGRDLRQIIMNVLRQKLLLPVPIGAFIISRVCRALEYAHKVIVHRDISPENVLINKQGVAKLTDFGVALEHSSETVDFAGKLQYMSPEQLNLQKIDARSDIFAIGLIAYQLATGISPLLPDSTLDFKSQYKFLKQLVKEDIPPAHKICRDIPLEYSNIISRMLSVSKLNRYQKISEVCNDLERKFLYAGGFGPTNNSLQAYLEIMDNNFQDYNQEQLKSLSFLADENRKVSLKRRISNEMFTELGVNFATERGAKGLVRIVIEA